MLIPLSTDAPIYHFPFATIGLIVANFICFQITGWGAGPYAEDWMLEYGHINPVEWLSSIFAHAGWVHLLGNMFFLWAFGLIVEGKLGWHRFLVVYLLVGCGQSALEQVLFLPLGEGSSCGASAAIFGLLAICLVWAPKNEFHVIMIAMFRMFSFDITIMMYSLWYFGWELLWVVLFAHPTAFLHMMGAFMGFGVGVLYLKKGWVDCENWDLFAVLKGTHGRFGDKSTTVGSHADPSLLFGKDVSVSEIEVAKDDKAPQGSSRSRRSKELKNICGLIDRGQFMEAVDAMMSLRMHDSDSRLDESRLKRMALGLIQANMPEDAEIYLEEYTHRFPETCAWAHVRIAQIHLTVNRRPNAALGHLKQVRLSALTPDMQKLGKKIASEAKKQVQAGVVDAEPEW
jgi:membrane associated rhomboid family serine protease